MTASSFAGSRKIPRPPAASLFPIQPRRSPSRARSSRSGQAARDEQGKVLVLDVKAGDRVLFAKWGGTEVKIDGEELLIMKESDILGVLEGKPSSRRAAA
jgi:chaperonin GroES